MDNKTIAVKLRFFTSDLPEKIKNKIPMWECGSVSIEANKTLGINATVEMFHSMDDVPRAIKKVLRRSKIVGINDYYSK